jgi:hypothetical protein
MPNPLDPLSISRAIDDYTTGDVASKLSFLEKAQVVMGRAPGKEPGPPGSVLALLATSAGILGALLGQLTLAFVLVNEIENLDVTGANRLLLWAIVGLSMLYACFYVSKGVWTVLREEERWGKSCARRRTNW